MTATDSQIIVVGRATYWTEARIETLRQWFHVALAPSKPGTVILHVMGEAALIDRLRNAYDGQTVEVAHCRRSGGQRVRGSQTAQQWTTGLAALLAATYVRLDENGLPLAQRPTTLREALGHTWLGEAPPDDDEEPAP